MFDSKTVNLSAEKIGKKLMAFLLLMILIFSSFLFVACGGESTGDSPKRILNTLIIECNTYKADDYSDESWAVFSNALKDAISVHNNPESDDEAFDSATAALTAAKSALVTAQAYLNSAIALADSLNSAMYTAISWRELQESLAEAKEVKNNATSTNKAKKAAAAALEIKMTQLESLDAPPTPVIGSTFYDDFGSGISNTDWGLNNSSWGQGNNGQKPANVSYTTNAGVVSANGATGGIVQLRGTGDYQYTSSNRRTGSVIITRDTFGPGRYEVRMKAFPRIGACTAMWTYYSSGSTVETNKYSEIDIEIPGRIDMNNTMYTTYSMYINDTTMDQTSQTKGSMFPNNDGEWHVYAFEWRTDPMRVDWYVDGLHVATSKTSVPEYFARFWVGHWYPLGWTGTPDFDEGYMFIDYVKIQSYVEANGKGKPTTITGSVAATSQATNLGSNPLAINNFISNGGFEVSTSSSDTFPIGWGGKTTGASKVADGGSNVMKLTGTATAVATADQMIQGVYKNYMFSLTADGKVISGEKVTIYVEHMVGTHTVKTEQLDFMSSSFETKTLNFTLSDEKFTGMSVNRIRITLFADVNTVGVFDNLKVLHLGVA